MPTASHLTAFDERLSNGPSDDGDDGGTIPNQRFPVLLHSEFWQPDTTQSSSGLQGASKDAPAGKQQQSKDF